MRKMKLIAALICAVFMVNFVGPAPQANAGFSVFPVFPTFFPPIKATGTIIDLQDPDGGDPCRVFKADSGTLYFFNGVDTFDVGTRLAVKGNLCTICLVALTCGMPVSPILNPVVTVI